MPTSRRSARVNHILRQELSNLLFRQVKDPRLSAFVSLTEVRVSQDLRHARVFVSIMGSDEEKVAVLAGLRSAANYLRHELRELIDLRYIPALTFILDESIERGARILTTLNKLSEEPSAREGPP